MSTEVARDGVRNRLWLGVAALFVTAFCFVAVVAVPQTQFGSAALGTFGFCALNLAVATILSARREEFVHRLAGRLEPPLLEKREGTDGHV